MLCVSCPLNAMIWMKRAGMLAIEGSVYLLRRQKNGVRGAVGGDVIKRFRR